MLLSEFDVDEIIFKNGSFPFTCANCIVMIRATERIVEERVRAQGDLIAKETGDDPLALAIDRANKAEVRVQELELALKNSVDCFLGKEQ